MLTKQPTRRQLKKRRLSMKKYKLKVLRQARRRLGLTGRIDLQKLEITQGDL